MSYKKTSSDILNLLQEKIDSFSSRRDWNKFHTPKNLSMALSVEAAELMEIFQWQDNNDDIDEFFSKNRSRIEDEVADIFIYLLRFSAITNINIVNATEKKIKTNEEKYPESLVKGQSKKYSEY